MGYCKSLKMTGIDIVQLSKTEMMPQNEKWEGLGKLRKMGPIPLSYWYLRACQAISSWKFTNYFWTEKRREGGGAHVVLESPPFIATTCRSAHKRGGSKGTGFYPSLCGINPWHPDIIMHILHTVLYTLPRF